MKKWCFAVAAAVFALAAAPQWKSMSDHDNRFAIQMPAQPEHLRDHMALDGGGTLTYDVFVAAADKQTVFMVLVAEYPVAIPEEEKANSLEYFLNGMVGPSGKNQLLSADLLKVQGHHAMDFHIQAQGSALRGRAIVTNKTLYLLAMEVKGSVNEAVFAEFVESFELKNP